MTLIVVVGCAVAALVTMLLAPLVLTMGRWQLMHPRCALTAWFSAFFLGIALIVSALVAGVVGAVTTSPLDAQAEALLLTAAGWLGLGGLGAALAFISESATSVTTHDGDTERALTALACAREERDGFDLVRVRSEHLLACAVPGRHPEILVTTALEEVLTPRQLQAVLAHEYAHLRARHDLALRIARINGACLRGTRPGRSLQQATRLLIELAADDVAARQAGAAHLANALSTLGDLTGAEDMRLRAERLASRRWPRSRRRPLPEAIRI